MRRKALQLATFLVGLMALPLISWAQGPKQNSGSPPTTRSAVYSDVRLTDSVAGPQCKDFFFEARQENDSVISGLTTSKFKVGMGPNESTRVYIPRITCLYYQDMEGMSYPYKGRKEKWPVMKPATASKVVASKSLSTPSLVTNVASAAEKRPASQVTPKAKSEPAPPKLSSEVNHPPGGEVEVAQDTAKKSAQTKSAAANRAARVRQDSLNAIARKAAKDSAKAPTKSKTASDSTRLPMVIPANQVDSAAVRRDQANKSAQELAAKMDSAARDAAALKKFAADEHEKALIAQHAKEAESRRADSLQRTLRASQNAPTGPTSTVRRTIGKDQSQPSPKAANPTVITIPGATLYDTVTKYVHDTATVYKTDTLRVPTPVTQLAPTPAPAQQTVYVHHEDHTLRNVLIVGTVAGIGVGAYCWIKGCGAESHSYSCSSIGSTACPPMPAQKSKGWQVGWAFKVP